MLLNAQNIEAVIRNDTRNPVKVQRHAPLSLAVPLEVDRVFSLGLEDHSLAAMPDFENMAGPETKTASGITVYGDLVKVAALLAVANSYPDIWIDRGTVARIPNDWMMLIHLRDRWQELNLLSKIYPAGPEDRKIINETFDKLTSHAKMQRAV